MCPETPETCKNPLINQILFVSMLKPVLYVKKTRFYVRETDFKIFLFEMPSVVPSRKVSIAHPADRCPG